jgi:hypothetical protein
MNHIEPMQVHFVEMQKSAAQKVLLKLWRLPREDIDRFVYVKYTRGNGLFFTHMSGTLTITASFQKMLTFLQY